MSQLDQQKKEKALSLLCEFLELFSLNSAANTVNPVDSIQTSETVKKTVDTVNPANTIQTNTEPGVIGKIKITDDHKKLLETWIRLHYTQWGPVSRVHDKETSASELCKDFFTSVSLGNLLVACQIFNAHKSDLFGISDFVHGVYRVKENELEHVCKVMRRCGLSPNDATPAKSYIFEAFLHACENNNIEFLQYLKYWGVDANIVRDANNKGLLLASQGGHIKVMKFLKDNWNLTHDDAYQHSNDILHEAIKSGNVEVLQHLKDYWGFTATDARSHTNFALRMAARNGHVNCLQFLKNSWGLTSDDARALNNHAIATATTHGKLEVLRYLKESFGLTKMDARSEGDKALHCAVQSGHDDVVLFLAKWIFN